MACVHTVVRSGDCFAAMPSASGGRCLTRTRTRAYKIAHIAACGLWKSKGRQKKRSRTSVPEITDVVVCVNRNTMRGLHMALLRPAVGFYDDRRLRAVSCCFAFLGCPKDGVHFRCLSALIFAPISNHLLLIADLFFLALLSLFQLSRTPCPWLRSLLQRTVISTISI